MPTIKPHLLPSNKTNYTKQANEFSNKQLDVFWTPEEIKVEKDVQDILVNMTPSEKHGVITVLKLFTLYELFAGDEYWSKRFTSIFPDDPAMHRMASVFTMFELAVHGPFYQKLNEALFLDDEAFYTSYIDNPVLKERMEFIDNIMTSKNDLASLGVFSMVEGAILYTSFGYLKHFQSQGKNKLLNVVRGINFSVRDENIHSLAGAWAFRTKKEQMNLSKKQEIELKETILNAVLQLYAHEIEITNMIFEKGPIDGITPVQLVHFVESRINVCLEQLGYEKHFNVPYNPIGAWFYKGINNFQFNDFFSGVGPNYNRNWDESAFEYKEYDNDSRQFI